jgi:hypothetical protein
LHPFSRRVSTPSFQPNQVLRRLIN